MAWLGRPLFELAQVGCDLVTVGRERLDLLRQDDTERFLLLTKPDVVIVAAGKVGGIHPNTLFRLSSFTRTS